MSNQTEAVAPTELLYMTFEGNWLTECVATVLAVTYKNSGDNIDDSNASKENGVVEICLDRTVFHAQGGGQPTDQGTLVSVEQEVTNIQENSTQSTEGAAILVRVNKVTIDRETGVATHSGTMAESAPRLQVGDQVLAKLDIEQRIIFSECHTAGHVVDAAMARCQKFLKPSKAYHFLDGPYVEYEGDVNKDERLTFQQALAIAFRQIVEEDIPTRIELMSKEEADAVCNRQAQNFDMDVFADKLTGEIRVVTVGGYACPCGGTHVRSTGCLLPRKWGVTGLKSKKGILRVKYGSNAC